MSAALGVRALVAGTALALSLVAFAVEGRLEDDASARAEALRELRVELQGAVHARARLERDAAGPDGGRLDALGVGLDDARIAILETADALPGSARIALLDRALRVVDGDPNAGPSTDAHVLRLVLELGAPHAVRLVEAIEALRRALPGRPVDVAGCRVERAHASGGGPDGVGVGDGAEGDGATSLIASCALDWHWWAP